MTFDDGSGPNSFSSISNERTVDSNSRFWPGVWDTLRWLSTVVAGLSLFYIARNLLHFGLSHVMTTAYRWYSGITHPILEPLEPAALGLMKRWGLSLPVWWKDIVVAYIALGGAMAKALVRRDADFGRKVGLSSASLGLGPLTELWAIIFWPFDMIAIVLVSIQIGSNRFWRSWGFEISKVIIAIVIFIAINAYV